MTAPRRTPDARTRTSTRSAAARQNWPVLCQRLSRRARWREPAASATHAVDGIDVLVANVGGRYRSIGSECTHEGCALHEGGLDAEDGVVTCACHGSMFDLETGEVVAPPAQEPEPVYRVRVQGDEIQVAKPS
jgi:3-phenylpropionate/trans-cinnamate dioxygenase ferredoxin subunit